MKKDMENECKFSDSYYLSTYSRDDATQIVHSLSNRLVAKQLRQVPTPYTMADAMAWLDDLEDEGSHSETAPIRWALRDTSSGKLIGGFSLRPAATAGTYSLGYWLAIEYWGKGIMTRAVAEVLGIVRKEVPKVQVVTAIVRERNCASQRVLEKSGFRRVGEHIGALSGTLLCDFELQL